MTSIHKTAQVVNSTDPVGVMLSALTDALTEHGGWVHVSDFVDGKDGNYTDRVWRSPATVNGSGKDFFLVITARTITSDVMGFYIRVAEEMQANQFVGWPMDSTSNYTMDDDSRTNFNNKFLDPTSATSSLFSDTASGNNTNFVYRFIVTDHGVYFHSQMSSRMYFVGVFDSFFPDSPNEFPLVAGLLPAVSGAELGVSRYPGKKAGDVSGSSGMAVYADPASYLNRMGPVFGSLPNTQVGFSGKVYGAPISIRHASGFAAYYGGDYTYRGMLHDSLGFSQAAAIQCGDTATIDGDPWICLGVSGSYGLWLNLAA